MIAARPILFSAPMVRALLAGAKTQTRRVLTVPWRGSTRTVPYEPYWVDTDGRLFFCDEYGDYHDVEKTRTSPYGVPGDRLWVRETWRVVGGREYEYQRDPQSVQFRADETAFEQKEWRPSIFLPRWASRLTLEVTEVRVQRVQDISEDDAKAEGVRAGDVGALSAVTAYKDLWDAINAKRGHGWDTNPWVWCVSFKRVLA